MMGGGETATGNKDGVRTAAIHVPIGWQRRVEGGHVVYVSPSGVMLPSLDEVKAYLLTDGTCKCGLECPLVIAKVFSFSVGAKVEHCPPLGKAEQDMTKLCNHRRKVVAMAALCRSMQASPLPFHGLQHPENSGVPDHHREPKRARPEDPPHHHHHHHHHKPHLLAPRLQPLPCPGPRHPSQLTHPYNGASPVGPHLDALRRLQPPPPPLLPASSSPSSSSPSPLLYGAPQWSPRPAPGPQNLSQGQRSTPRTPEGPGSPRVGPLASPPPPSSSPSPRSLGARPPPSPSPSPSSPSVHGASCASPRGQRSRHPSSSASSLSGEHGGGVVAGGDGLMGSPFPPPRRKSSSSSPLSPLPGGSPSPGLHFRYKVEDLLEHCRTHGPLPANQSSGFSALKPPKSPQGGMGSSLGPFLAHHHHLVPQSRPLPPHPASFPASSLLSAAAKAQLAASQASPGGDAPASASAPEPPHPHQQKVTNSTLLGSHHSPPSLLLLPPHYTLVASCSPSSSSPSPGPPSPRAERGAHHRKRQRRASKDPQPLANGARRTPPGDAVINLSSSSSSFPPSTSACVVDPPHHHLPHRHPYLLAPPGHTPRLSPRPTPVLTGPPRQTEALDFTTGLGGGFPGPPPSPLPPDPPTQPLSALLHLLSVQNAHATSSSSALQVGVGPSRGGGAAGSRHSPRPLSFSSSSSSSSPASHSGLRSVQTPSPRRHGNPAPLALSPAPSPSLCPSPALTGPVPSPSRPPVQRLSPLVLSPPPPGLVGCFSFPVSTAPPTADRQQPAPSATLDLSRSRGCAVPTATPASPKPLDLSNHVLALLAASSTSSTATANHTTGPEEVVGSGTKPPECHSASDDPGHPVPQPHPPATAGPSPLRDGCSPPGPGSSPGDAATPLSLAEAFPFMNQEQLLQLLSATGGLPSLLDPALLASLPLGGALWLGGQQQQAGHLPPSPSHSPPEQQQPHLLVQTQDHHHHNQQKHHHHQQQLFPLLPSLVGAHGDLPLGLLGLLNPLLPPPGPPGPDGDMGALAAEKAGLQALLMASLLLGGGQHHQGGGGGGPMLPPLGLEVPLQPEGLDPAGTAGVSLQGGPGLLEMLQGLLLPPGSAHEGPLQALLLPGPLAPPTQPHAFLPLSPALLSALGGADMHQPPSQVTSDPGVDTLIPLPLQSKDNPILQQLLPTLLNPAVLGDLSCLASLQNLLGLGAGHLLLPAGQASALGMPLLHGPDGAINLLNNIQLNIAPPPEGDKPMPPQETQNPPHQQDPAANHVASPEAVLSSPAPDRSPAPPPPQQHRGGGGVIDPYTSFMDTIYTSFLQVSAKEQRGGGGGGDPVSPFCALPPVSFPGDGGPALSPRRACSLRHPELSRLSLEAAARSPAQGTPRPSDDAPAGPRHRGKEGGGGRGGGGGHAHAHSEQPLLPPAYLEEAKTDCAPRQPLRPYGDGPGGGGGVGLRAGEMVGALLHTEQEGDQAGAAVGGRRGRKRKQTLQKVLEDFRDMDTTALEETKPTTVLLKPERAGRGRRRRGARSQRQ